MQLYQVEGVTFIVHEGEVYTRQLSVEDDEREARTIAAPEPVEEKPKEVERKKYTKKAGRKPSSCGHCGETGHQKRTCPKLHGEDDSEDSALAAINKALIENRAKVARMVRDGKSEREIYAAMHDYMTEVEFRTALELAGA